MAPLAPFAIAATAAAGVVGAIGASQAAKAAKATGIAINKVMKEQLKLLTNSNKLLMHNIIMSCLNLIVH